MLKTRIITAVIALAAIAVVLFAIPAQYTEVIIGLLLLGGAWEWSGFLGTDKRPLRIVYVLIVGAALAAVHLADTAQRDIVLLVACAWWVVAFLWNLRFPTPIPAAVRWLCGVLGARAILCTLPRRPTDPVTARRKPPPINQREPS